MEHDPLTAATPRRGVPTFMVEAVVAVVLIILGAVVVYQSRLLGAGWTSDGPGAGYFPFYIGLMLVISGVGVLVQSVFGKARDTGVFVDSVQLRRVLSVLLPAVVYVLAMVFVGIYVASVIYIALFMILLGKYPPLKSIVIALLINAVFFFMFEVWFQVPLYKGSLDPLAFLGY